MKKTHRTAKLRPAPCTGGARRGCIRALTLAGALLCSVASVALAQVPEAMRITRKVHGYEITMAVTSSKTNREIVEHRLPHASSVTHRVLVSFRSEASGHPVDTAEASIDVAEQGFAGSRVPLEPLRPGKNGWYEAAVEMSVATPYRILVHARPEGGTRMLEAQFEYRHHH